MPEYTMYFSRDPSGSRKYVLVLAPAPPCRTTGPSSATTPWAARCRKSASGVPGHTKRRRGRFPGRPYASRAGERQRSRSAAALSEVPAHRSDAPISRQGVLRGHLEFVGLGLLRDGHDRDGPLPGRRAGSY